MAPNPRVKNAFLAMKAIGISEAKVKPVLKKLLKLYDKNWELIEEENYRALADTIFEEDDVQGPQGNENANEGNLGEEAQEHDEPERPLKRLRLRNLDGQIPSSLINRDPGFAGATLKRAKVEDEDMRGTNSLQHSPEMRRSQPRPISPGNHARNMGKQPVSPMPLAIQQSSNPSEPCAMDRTLPSGSLSPQMRHSHKGKEPLLPEVASKEKRPILEGASRAVRIRDPVGDPGIVLLPKKRVPDTHALIIPKVEPFTDDMPLDGIPQFEVPIAVIRPESSGKEISSIRGVSMEEPDGEEAPESRLLAREDRRKNVPSSSNETRANCELATIPEDSPANLEIATSPMGEVKISLSCNSILGRPNFHMPSQDELLKSMEEKCLRSYKILDPNFSVMKMLKDMCECFLELATDSSHESQEGLINVTSTLDLLKKSAARSSLGVGNIEEDNYIPISISNGSINVHCPDGVAAPQTPRLPQSSNGLEHMQSSEGVIADGCFESGKGKELREPESCSLVVVPQCPLTPEELRSIYNLSDITKGEEIVEIPWFNEINNEYPPSFNYIPGNLAFQNAYVNFTLSQIKAENCCSSCIRDCLSSSTPCVCNNEDGHGFAYTLEGLVKEGFLEDCISMTRDRLRQCLSYCRDCPVERAKNDEMLEPCKGHLKRKYIKECWSKCGCHKQCGNRVVQRGITCKLQVFFTPEGKGWGLRTLEKLPKGAFVCEYVGEILTTKELYERKMQRTRSIDSRKLAYPVLLDAYWCLKGVLKDEEALCLDATFYGNVARFINHRCLDANLVEIPVKMETQDHHYYHLAFFTTREVDALEELTWDYGIDFDDNDHPVEAFQCRCASKFCRNMKRSNRSKSISR